MTLAFGLSLAVACGDSGDGPPRIEACEAFFVGDAICAIPDFDVRAKLEGCAGDPTAGGCHAGSNRILTVMELDLTNPSSTVEGELTPLIDMLSSNGSYLLDSEDANCSYMLRKLTSNPGIGSRMPPPQSTESIWSNDEIECFRAYVQQTFGF
ncbi:MAG: hypothetical protein DRH23_12410 [Deltaproteobacteria bacterium]|nr:MAG: hypothetical protein DRH23_12410 [Deltaproteobacteria bacterium]